MAPSVRILAVEDEPLLQRLLVTALKNRGYRVDICADGEEALGKIDQATYHLIITDFRMPRMTGIELIRALQARRERIPIVLTSSDTLEEMKIADQEVAAVEFLRKPYGLTDLYNAVQRALNRS
jgi:CheY-like chemotaxis protein